MPKLTVSTRDPHNGKVTEHAFDFADEAKARTQHNELAKAMVAGGNPPAVAIEGDAESMVVTTSTLVSCKLTA